MDRHVRRLAGVSVYLVFPLLAAAAGACASRQPQLAPGAQALSCSAPLEPYLRVDLYMDRSNPNDPSGRLTDEEWQRFVDEVLLKYFPAGGTIIANAGWWRRPDGSASGGVGRTLVLLARASEAKAHRNAVQAVIADYKKRYRQQSVLWEEDWVCAAF